VTKLLLVGAGGFLGSISRFLIAELFVRPSPGAGFPWGMPGWLHYLLGIRVGDIHAGKESAVDDGYLERCCPGCIGFRCGGIGLSSGYVASQLIA
jgi:hypothetical protein